MSLWPREHGRQKQVEEIWVAPTFDSGVVFIHKVALDELDGESGFSDA